MPHFERTVVMPNGQSETYVAHRNRAGEYVLAGPNAGRFRNRVQNQVCVREFSTADALRAMGFDLRMKKPGGKTVLIAAKNVCVVGS